MTDLEVTSVTTWYCLEWFYRSGGGIEDPVRWKKYYTDIRFMPLDTPEGGVICG